MASEAQTRNGTASRPPSQYSERLVTHVTPDVADRLRLQAALQDRPPAHLADEVLGKGLMTFEQLAEETLRKRGNGNGAH
jgi:hypothetical protein